MGAILAHELTHHFLFNKGVVYDDINENERLTDLATVYLGLGKLTLNGYEPVTWRVKRKDGEVTYTYKVGYLTSMDMAMIFERVCSFRHIPIEYAEINLTPIVAELVKVYSGIVARHKKHNKIERAENLKDKISRYTKKIFHLLCRGRPSDEAVSIENKLRPFADEEKIIINCSNCGQKMRIPLRNCNLRVKCPRCSNEFITPSQR